MARPQLPTSDSRADLARRALSSASTQLLLTFSAPTIAAHRTSARARQGKRHTRTYGSSRLTFPMAATASLSAVAAPLSVVGLKKPLGASASAFRPLPRARPAARMAFRASASMKEKATAGLTAAAMAAALVLPDIAEAAQPGLSPSLKNFLLSIVSGGVVLVAIVGAVVAVSNFDPVKRA